MANDKDAERKARHNLISQKGTFPNYAFAFL